MSKLPLVNVEGEKRLSHNLQPLLKTIAAFKGRSDYHSSLIYKMHGSQIRALESAMEWSNLIQPDTHAHTKHKGHLRVVHWNIERGKNLDGILDFMKSHTLLAESDVILLTEADIGMARSGNKNIPREVAKHLGMNYCFANSFVCLDKGDESERHFSEENSLALHGVAILSKFPLQSAISIELPLLKDLFTAKEKRLGCRRALVCRARIGDREIDFIVVHLDLQASPRQRAWQLEELLKRLSSGGLYDPTRAQLIGGDFNTCTLDLRSGFSLAKDLLYTSSVLGIDRQIEELMRPHEKGERALFKALRHYGFEIEGLNDLSNGTLRVDLSDRLSTEKARQFLPSKVCNWIQDRVTGSWPQGIPVRLDWFAARGLNLLKNGVQDAGVNKPSVISLPSNPKNGSRLSDHFPILIDLAFEPR